MHAQGVNLGKHFDNQLKLSFTVLGNGVNMPVKIFTDTVLLIIY